MEQGMIKARVKVTRQSMMDLNQEISEQFDRLEDEQINFSAMLDDEMITAEDYEAAMSVNRDQVAYLGEAQNLLNQGWR